MTRGEKERKCVIARVRVSARVGACDQRMHVHARTSARQSLFRVCANASASKNGDPANNTGMNQHARIGCQSRSG